MSQISAYLDDLSSRLGSEKTGQIIKFSMPYVSQKEQQLHESLKEARWREAAEHAHKALSAVRLFGSARLESLLVQIRDGVTERDNIPDMLHELSDEFSSVCREANGWLLKRCEFK